MTIKSNIVGLCVYDVVLSLYCCFCSHSHKYRLRERNNQLHQNGMLPKTANKKERTLNPKKQVSFVTSICILGWFNFFVLLFFLDLAFFRRSEHSFLFVFLASLGVLSSFWINYARFRLFLISVFRGKRAAFAFFTFKIHPKYKKYYTHSSFSVALSHGLRFALMRWTQNNFMFDIYTYIHIYIRYIDLLHICRFWL